MSNFIKVFGRFRPSASGEMATAIRVHGKNCVKMSGVDGKEDKTYDLHRVFESESSQEEVFSVVAKKLVEECTEGINGTIFAYGQTGSGKTHTMLGPGSRWSDPDSKGLIPRSIEHLFSELEKKAEECLKFTFMVTVEFVELYNDKIYDLLNGGQTKITLRDNGADIMLSGASSETVECYSDLMQVVKIGWESRKTGQTAMNRDSSRSHAMLILKIQSEEMNGSMSTIRRSTLNLVDLAGSERQSQTKAAGERLKEATKINGSLSVLGRCIRILSSQSGEFVPLRESPLTHILKNSLGGNSRTVVIVNMHPDKKYALETASTLAFASACSMIKNNVQKNEEMSSDQEEGYKDTIRQLRRQIDDNERRWKDETTKRDRAKDAEVEKLHDVISQLRYDNQEVRTKYKMAISDNPELKKLPSLSDGVSRMSISERPDILQLRLDELIEKYELLSLEFEQRGDELEKTKHELADYRSKYATDQLNETMSLSLMRTPSSKRKSSRNSRRETLYHPSPSRIKENEEQAAAEVSAKEEEIQQLREEYRILFAEKEEIQRAFELSDGKIAGLRKQLLEKEKKHSKEANDLENENYRLNEELKRRQEDVEELELKITKGAKEIEMLFMRLNEKDTALKMADSARKAEIDSFNKEIDEQQQFIDILRKEKQDLLNQLNEQDQRNETFENELQDKLSKKDEDLKRVKLESDKLVLEITAANRKLVEQTSQKDTAVQHLEDVIESKRNIEIELQDKFSKKDEDLKRVKLENDSNSKLVLEITAANRKLVEQLSQKDTAIKHLEDVIESKSQHVRTVVNDHERVSSDYERLKLKLEDFANHNRLLQKQNEELKDDSRKRFADHQLDMSNARSRFQRQLQEAEAAHVADKEKLQSIRKKLEDEKVEWNTNFNLKMDEAIKSYRMQNRKELAEREEQLKIEFSEEKKSLEKSSERKLRQAAQRIEVLEKQHEDDSATIKEMAGHSNRGQKISYLNNIRQKLTVAETENKKLLEESARCTCKKSSNQEQNVDQQPRVLRARNRPNV